MAEHPIQGLMNVTVRVLYEFWHEKVLDVFL